MTATSAVRSLFQTFATAYPQRRLVWVPFIAVALLAPVAWLWGYTSNPPTRTDSLYPLLAGLPATLGTLFVLAFTFTLITAQVASNYNHILFHRVMGLWALWYAVPFAVGILLPFFLLYGHFYLWAVYASLLIGAFCVVSLLPFAVAVRELLSVPGAIEDKARELLDANSEADAHDLIREMGNITVGALTLRDFATFECGVEKLVECAEGTTSTDLRLPITRELRRIIFRNADNPFAAEILIESITRVGLGNGHCTSLSVFPETLDEIEGAYRSVNIAALWGQEEAINRIVSLTQRQPTAIVKCQTLLYIIGERAISEIPVEAGSARSVILVLGQLLQENLSASSLEPGDDQVSMSAILRLEYLGTRAMLHHKTALTDFVLQQLQSAAESSLLNQQPMKRHIEAVIARLDAPRLALLDLNNDGVDS